MDRRRLDRRQLDLKLLSDQNIVTVNCKTCPKMRNERLVARITAKNVQLADTGALIGLLSDSMGVRTQSRSPSALTA